jgi:nitrilase
MRQATDACRPPDRTLYEASDPAMTDPTRSATPFRVAALQMVSTPDVARNLADAGHLIEQAAADGAQLVLLPEYFCFMGHRDTDKLALAEPYRDGPIQQFLRRPRSGTASG